MKLDKVTCQETKHVQQKSYKAKTRQVLEEQMRQRHYQNDQNPCRSQIKPQAITNEQIQKCQEHQYQQMRMYRQGHLRVWYQIQSGLIVTKQNLKTGGEKSDYFSRATELQRQMIGSQRSQLASEEVQWAFTHRESLMKNLEPKIGKISSRK